MEAYLYNVLFRWGHIVVGIAWIGLLYYFNFVQTEYVKKADPEAKKDVMQKLAPNALWWFRWAAFFTFLTGLYLLYVQERMITTAITLGTLMGTIMMLNVWGIIWRNQKIVIGLKEGDAVAAGAKAALASRTNTLLSLPMLYFMVSSAHGGSAAYPKSYLLIDGYLSTGFWIVFVAVLLIEMNAIFGKMFPVITSVRSVITSSLLLTIVCSGLVFYL
ncbi:MAG: urate hydroxylase PuuD [Pseudomonadota bacterium]|jgi:uncharacterized membrane protein|nr:urate hydroxylase PuuD [SAR86 cluster bacterium]MEC7269449.1 urate hydroxylase PuuD [Pseudomonadota bacterium]MEC7465574.1 urate hydroxylase PuuD [Pseudomonadota bacterium]MEC7786897.1 urate hydroxylase PuuD [Pseudomonadota bacterium]MEC8169419.1 urate hydroxylase PuuD [Pseudomonadota bacterium]|tara:strand:+ start:73 stop:723 length:651 start_codon:yes stop_codon:yes gene_type:complete